MVEKAITLENHKMSHFYPKIELNERNFLLAIYPEFHTKLFPDSKLKTEHINTIVDKKYANSISKVYLSKAPQAKLLKPEDILLIYRTKDKNTNSPAYYSSVATSICIVKEIKNINDFSSPLDFKSYCNGTSVFNNNDLQEFYNKEKYTTAIKFDYYFSLDKRITRANIIKIAPRLENERWTLLKLKDSEIKEILTISNNFKFIKNK